MIAVDVNVIAYLWIPGEFTQMAERVLKKDSHWVAPVLWRSEFRNILAGYIRRGILTADFAGRCLEGAENHLAGHEFFLPSHLIMRKVAVSECSAYDCEYVALAEDLNVKLVTLDSKILKEFPDISLNLKAFADPNENEC